MKTKFWFALATLWMASAAQAALVVELEADTESANNSLVTAQLIPSSAFTTPAPADAFFSLLPTATIVGNGGLDDVDFYGFFAPAGASVIVDVDNDPFSFDTLAFLFDPFGTLIGYGDDFSPADPGSETYSDAVLGPLPLTTSGIHFLAIVEFPNYATQALLHTETPLTLGGLAVSGAAIGVPTFDFNGPQTAGLPYTVNVTVTPEPGTMALFGMGLMAIGFTAGRQRSRK